MFHSSLSVALSHIRENKLHGSLATLGVIVGCATLIATLSVGEGVKRQVLHDIEALGTNLIFIHGQPTYIEAGMKNPEKIKRLTLQDIPVLQKECPGIASIVPQVFDRTHITFKAKSVDTNLEGTSPQSASIRSWNVSAGRFLWQNDLDDYRKVCVLGSNVANNLFGNENPVGQSVTLDNTPYSVIGVLESKGNVFNMEYDDRVMIPLPTAQQRASTRENIDGLLVSSTTPESIPSLVTNIRSTLKQNHAIENFQIWSQDEFLNQRQKILFAFDILMGSLAIISLVVGGIGIMNIMLAAVYDRIREIGIRKALGAKPFDIFGQFLAESVLISLIGGFLGIGLGFFLGSGVARGLAHYVPLSEPWVSVFSIKIILIAFGFAVLVGMLFGLYPAIRASKLNPAEALRYE